MALASAALLLVAAADGEVVQKNPFRDIETVNTMMTDLQFQDPPHIDQNCGEMELVIELTLPPAGQVRDVEIDGPKCAVRRIENLRAAIMHAPRSHFVLVERITRCRFKMRFTFPRDAI